MWVNHHKFAVYFQTTWGIQVVVAIGLSYLPRMASYNEPALDNVDTVSYASNSTDLLDAQIAVDKLTTS